MVPEKEVVRDGIDGGSRSASSAPERPGGLIAGTFTAAVFLNAVLLFAVEPMFSKMALPLLGGTPAVWNTCMLFFQAALLAGYLYAHALTRRVRAARQPIVHLVLLAASALALPISVRSALGARPDDHPVLWLIALLTVSLGAPFVVLSSGAPLLQRWFARTGHRDAANPYFLYAASNLGSMIALMAYPSVIEPLLGTTAQARVWSGAYVALVGLVGACAMFARSRDVPVVGDADTSLVGQAAPTLGATDAVGDHLTVSRRAMWVLLAAVPSSLLFGVTTYLSTDIAAIPLLWVIPLATYLLTFVVAFSSRVWFRPVIILGLQAVFLLWLTVTMSAELSGLVRVMAPAHIGLLFLSALACHTRLAADRPPVTRLTEFYLWISLGGMLGGVFNVLIAPNVFVTVAEYPIAIVLAAAVRPGGEGKAGRWSRWLDVPLPLAIAAAMWLLLRNGVPVPGWTFRKTLLVFVLCALPSLAFYRRPLRFALALAAIFAVAGQRFHVTEEILFRDRSFFGVHTVARMGDVRVLRNGTTMHGAQSTDSARALDPLTYYHARGPAAQALTTLGVGHESRHVAVIGLGTGSLACYGGPNESWTFYELDPLVEQIARNPAYFTFLRDCPPAKRVVLGDARLELADAPARSYEIIVVDAFASDAIPTHLLTREALALYLDKLSPDGAVLFHISNRYLELEPVIAGVAKALGAAALVGSDGYLSPEERVPFTSLSKWMAVSRSTGALRALGGLEGWRVANGEELWTDDYTNVLGAFR